LYHFLSHAATGSKVQGQASSSWGWTSSTGREFVAIGQLDGTAFVEVSKEGKMIYLGRLESGDGIGARWREIRTVGDHIVVGSEAFDHGIQFFDMKKLLTLDPASPKTFTNADLASHWGRVSQGNPADAWDKLPVVSAAFLCQHIPRCVRQWSQSRLQVRKLLLLRCHILRYALQSP